MSEKNKKMLFDDIERDLENRKTRGMPIFTYINLSSRPEIEDLRNTWNNFFEEFPQNHGLDLKNRFRSKDNRQHLSAAFELFLYTLFKRMTYTVVVHPETDSEKNSRPDFKITTNDDKDFYVEAKCVFGDDVETPDDKRKKKLLDGITNIKHDKYRLIVEFDGSTADNPKINVVKHDIIAWLNELDYSKIMKFYNESGRRSLPQKKFKTAGLIIGVRAKPVEIGSDHDNDRDTISEFHPYAMARRGNAHELIRKALREKGKQYGKTGLPIIIAVNVFDIFFDNEDIFDALFGDRVFYFHRGPCPEHKTADHLPNRKFNGFWISPNGPTYTRVYGCLFFKSADVSGLLYENPNLVLNPYSGDIDEIINIPYFNQYIPNMQRGDYDFKEFESPSKLFLK